MSQNIQSQSLSEFIALYNNLSTDDKLDFLTAIEEVKLIEKNTITKAGQLHSEIKEREVHFFHKQKLDSIPQWNSVEQFNNNLD